MLTAYNILKSKNNDVTKEVTQMERDDSAVRPISALVFLAGIWLIISPFLLSYGSSSFRADQIIFGIIIAVLAAIQYFFTDARWASWLAALAGLWMVIAPYAMSNASTGARWASVIGGLVAFFAALSNAMSTRGETHIHRGHGQPV
jgi:hypothetical protein